jgi:hypothetical protein
MEWAQKQIDEMKLAETERTTRARPSLPKLYTRHITLAWVLPRIGVIATCGFLVWIL